MKPVIILHGWASNPSHWTVFVKEMKAVGFRVIKPDLPGFKKPLDKPFNTQDYVDWLDQYLKDNRLSSVVLIGQSLGGQIAIQFTAQHKKRVDRLVLISAAGIRSQFNLKKNVFWVLAKLGKLVTKSTLAKKWLYRIARERDYLEADEVMKQTLKKIVTEDQQANLKKINLPTLLCWGGKDRYTSVKQGRLMHKLLKNSSWHFFPNAGHGLHFTEPKTMVKIISQFCR